MLRNKVYWLVVLLLAFAVIHGRLPGRRLDLQPDGRFDRRGRDGSGRPGWADGQHVLDCCCRCGGR